MRSLADVQAAMKNSIITGEVADFLPEMVKADGLSPEQRLQIHRNHYRESLTEVLRTVFPGSIAFVGDEFFTACVAEFLKVSPPEKPQLISYGGDFAAFFKSFPPAKKVAYVGDLMALEWAVHDSQNDRDLPVIGAVDIPAAIDAKKLSLAPSARLIRSDFPVVSLWMVSKGQLQPEVVHLKSGGEQAIVVRIDGAVQIQPLDPDDYDLLTCLQRQGVSGLTDVGASLEKLVGLADRKIFV